MKKLTAIILLACGLCPLANADVWMWVDANGKTHYVDTMTPIYTWIGDNGKVNYSDTPDHPDAVAVQLVWHSTGTLDGSEKPASAGGGSKEIDPNETVVERREREIAEAYYCKRATEIYDSYVNAPRLYKTNDAGKIEYLSEQDAEATIAETKAKVDELCKNS